MPNILNIVQYILITVQLSALVLLSHSTYQILLLSKTEFYETCKNRPFTCSNAIV